MRGCSHLFQVSAIRVNRRLNCCEPRSPSLYFGAPHTTAPEQFPNEFNTIVSGPTDRQAGHWRKVDEVTCVHWARERINLYPIRLG